MKHLGGALHVPCIALCVLAACDDPVPGPVGAVVLVVRTFEAPEGSRFADVASLTIAYDSIVAVVDDADGGSSHTVVDAQLREIVLPNLDADVFVAQLEVPVGELAQFRLSPHHVTLAMNDGTRVELDPDGADLPSWRNTGWKVVASEGDFAIREDEPLGVRALFAFDDRLVFRAQDPVRAKVKPTVQAEAFRVNPAEGAPGVYIDELTVVFHEGVSHADVDAIGAELGATVLRRPLVGRAYRIHLPPTINLEEAYRFYGARSEVRGILPGTNYAFSEADPDLRHPHGEVIRVEPAWDTVHDALGGAVGDRRVRVAIIDSGMLLSHPELYLNVAIHQGELPHALFDVNGTLGIQPDDIAVFDTDGDGVISFVDLNALRGDPDPVRAAVVPVELATDENDYIDALDLLADVRWRNGINEDGNGLTDDLVGWDFTEDGDGDPTDELLPVPEVLPRHGTRVAQVIGADGDNGAGTAAGLVWEVSLIPLRVTAGTGAGAFGDLDVPSAPNDRVLDAIEYAEALGADVINVSLGWTYVRKDAGVDRRGVPATFDVTDGIPPAVFGDAVELANAVFRGAPWLDPDGSVASRSLYVFSAGNGFYPISSPLVLRAPAELLAAAIPDNVVIAGAARGLLDGIVRNNSLDTASNYTLGDDRILYGNDGWLVGGLTPTGAGPLATLGGTSSACAQVSGAAALYLSLHRSAAGRPDFLRTRLFESARPIVEVHFQPDFRFLSTTELLLDVQAALEVAP